MRTPGALKRQFRVSLVFCLAVLGQTFLHGAAGAKDLQDAEHGKMTADASAAVFDWKGIYLGGFAGGTVGTVTYQDVTYPNLPPFPNVQTHSAALGGLAGVNFQFNRFVYGGELDVGFTPRRGEQEIAAGPFNIRSSVRGDWTARARLRLGVTWRRLLFFSAAGGSLTNNQISFSIIPGDTEKLSHNLLGANLGVGVDYQITKHIFARVEYINDFYGKTRYNYLDINPNGFGNHVNRFGTDTGRLAILYRF